MNLFRRRSSGAASASHGLLTTRREAEQVEVVNLEVPGVRFQRISRTREWVIDDRMV